MTKGYAAIGVEGGSKARNIGAVLRTAHAFDAAFVFLVASRFSKREVMQSDTSKSINQRPLYLFDTSRDLALPQGCQLVGVEMTEDAGDLPSFHHPRMAAYILGSERMGLSDEMISLCDHVIKIPTQFSLNLAVTGALVLYDRLQSLGRFAPRPMMPGAADNTTITPDFGKPLWHKKHARKNQSFND